MNANVMVVDDDPAICYTVREVFAASGLSAVAAESGDACLAMLRGGFRGVILLDIMMPGKDGWQTLEAIRDEGLTDGCIVCMLTAISEPGQRMEGLQESVLDYVRKPFDPMVLVRTAERYLSYLKHVA